MPHISDHEFVNRLLGATIDGKIDWEPTAQGSAYTASFAGKWTVAVTAIFIGIATSGIESYRYALTLRDSEGALLLNIDDEHDNRIGELHELARRRALKVDQALEDLFKELDEEQP